MRHAWLALALIAGCSPARSPSATRPVVPTAAPPVDAAPPADEIVDRGTFVLSIGGQPLGEEEFTIARRGDVRIVRSTSSIDLGNATMTIEGELRVDAAWKPIDGAWRITRGSPVEIKLARREGDGVLVQSAAHTEAAESKPSDVYALSNVMSHFSMICALAAEEPKRLVVFPGLDLELGARSRRAFAITAHGAASTRELDLIDATLAATTRMGVACDGPELVALGDPLQGFGAARKGAEEIAAALAGPTREKPATPAGLVEEEREVTVAAQGDDVAAVLSCTLLRPEKVRNKQRLPAVAFFTGSGGQDRDEDTPGPAGLKLSIFKVLAIALGEQGIASLRCDDRGVARSTGDANKATLFTFVRDAQAIVAALRAEPTIDPARIGFVGHSEGAVVALAVGVADPKLRAIVLMAGTGRPLDQVVLDQVADAMRKGGAKEDEIRAKLEERRTVYDLIRDGKPLPDSLEPDERRALEAAAPWLRSHFVTDPAALAAKLSPKIAVLIAQGDKDFQVSVVDAEKLRDAVSRAGGKPETRIYGGLNHLFSIGKHGGLADYTDPDARVDPGFVSDVQKFLGARLAK